MRNFFFFLAGYPEFVEIKSLISFNLVGVIYTPKNVLIFFFFLMGIRSQNSGTRNSRPLNNSYLVHCDTDLYARI